jgi:hypothetical protein
MPGAGKNLSVLVAIPLNGSSMAPTTKPRRTSILINPREPLTKKAKGAITTFVTMTGKKKGTFVFVLIDAVLKAERMQRAQLYKYLEDHGHVWTGYYWTEKEPKNEK